MKKQTALYKEDLALRVKEFDEDMDVDKNWKNMAKLKLEVERFYDQGLQRDKIELNHVIIKDL